MEQQYNLVYMSKPRYGGWVTFTAHLANKYYLPLYKIGNRTENRTRLFGYDIRYQNITIDELIKLPNLLITCIDKNYYEYLPKITNATIVIHDPTELKAPVLECLKRFKIITIRKTVSQLLKSQYKLDNKFMYHPLYQFPKIGGEKVKAKAVSLSRVDFDKHTDIIVKANDSGCEIDIYGSMNELYVYHKLRETDFRNYYKGRFDKTFEAINEILADCKYVIDMSVIKGDGGGSQYTFLEAIYMDCCLILNKKWVDGLDSPFKHNHNCFIVENHEELTTLLKSNPDTSEICKNAKELLKNHTE